MQGAGAALRTADRSSSLTRAPALRHRRRVPSRRHQRLRLRPPPGAFHTSHGRRWGPGPGLCHQLPAPLTAGTPGGKSRLGLRTAGESRRSSSDQLSTHSVNAGRSVPRPTWSTQTAEQAGGRLVRKRRAGASGIPLPLARPWPGRGLSAPPGSPRCSRAESPCARGGAARLCLGVPLGGSTPLASPEAARAGKQTVLEGKGFLNR